MSDSVRPHRCQPTRLPRPWDPPGKNTGMGCHFLLQYMKVKSENQVTQLCPTLSDPMDCSYQAPPSMGFSRQEYWSGVPLPSPSYISIPQNKTSVSLKNVQDLYTENYKTLIKEIKGELNKWRDVSCSWIATLVKMSVPGLILRFSATSIIILLGHFMDIYKLILKFMWRGKIPKRANKRLKKTTIGELILPNSKVVREKSFSLFISHQFF